VRQGQARESFAVALGAAMALVRGTPTLAIQCVTAGIGALLGTGITASLVALSVGAPTGGNVFVGLALAAIAAGTFVGTAAFGFWRLGVWASDVRVALMPVVLMALCAGLVGSVPKGWALLVVLVAAGSVSMLIELIARARIAASTPDEMLGRAFSLVITSVTLGTIAGALAAAGPILWLGFSRGFAVIALTAVLVAVGGTAVLQRLPLPVDPLTKTENRSIQPVAGPKV